MWPAKQGMCESQLVEDSCPMGQKDGRRRRLKKRGVFRKASMGKRTTCKMGGREQETEGRGNDHVKEKKTAEECIKWQKGVKARGGS